MGNNLSTTSNSALLFLDEQFTRAGETVRGSVYVNVYDTNAQFNGLAIQVGLLSRPEVQQGGM